MDAHERFRGQYEKEYDGRGCQVKYKNLRINIYES